MAKHKEKDLKSWPIYLYVPNLIGYARIVANIIAFGESFSNKNLFAALYFFSFVCDELDGRFARMLNQASTFGAVLDMVTDSGSPSLSCWTASLFIQQASLYPSKQVLNKFGVILWLSLRVSTAALLVVLSHLYRPCFAFFLALLALDIASHWLQMYSTFLSSKTSHKDVKDSKSWLVRVYYQHRLFMGYCCIGAEVLYLVLYLLSEDQPHGLIEVFMAGIKQKSPLMLLGLLALPGWAIKQIVNVVQLKTAADICVLYDLERNKRP